MADGWKNYRGAPQEGAVLCETRDIHDESAKSIVLDSAAGRFPVLLVRTRGAVRAFVNACPHQYLPLDHRGERLLSADGTILRCTNHYAGFRVEDGVGVEGLGQGCALDLIPVSVDPEGWIRVGAILAQDQAREAAP